VDEIAGDIAVHSDVPSLWTHSSSFGRVIDVENASSVPGRTQTATAASSAAANPRVQVPKSRVVSLSPTFAGRDLTF
jgi:hypothetical protein